MIKYVIFIFLSIILFLLQFFIPLIEFFFNFHYFDSDLSSFNNQNRYSHNDNTRIPYTKKIKYFTLFSNNYYIIGLNRIQGLECLIKDYQLFINISSLDLFQISQSCSSESKLSNALIKNKKKNQKFHCNLNIFNHITWINCLLWFLKFIRIDVSIQRIVIFSHDNNNNIIKNNINYDNDHNINNNTHNSNIIITEGIKFCLYSIIAPNPSNDNNNVVFNLSLDNIFSSSNIEHIYLSEFELRSTIPIKPLNISNLLTNPNTEISIKFSTADIPFEFKHFSTRISIFQFCTTYSGKLINLVIQSITFSENRNQSLLNYININDINFELNRSDSENIHLNLFCFSSEFNIPVHGLEYLSSVSLSNYPEYKEYEQKTDNKEILDFATLFYPSNVNLNTNFDLIKIKFYPYFSLPPTGPNLEICCNSFTTHSTLLLTKQHDISILQGNIFTHSIEVTMINSVQETNRILELNFINSLISYRDSRFVIDLAIFQLKCLLLDDISNSIQSNCSVKADEKQSNFQLLLELLQQINNRIFRNNNNNISNEHSHQNRLNGLFQYFSTLSIKVYDTEFSYLNKSSIEHLVNSIRLKSQNISFIMIKPSTENNQLLLYNHFNTVTLAYLCNEFDTSLEWDSHNHYKYKKLLSFESVLTQVQFTDKIILLDIQIHGIQLDFSLECYLLLSFLRKICCTWKHDNNNSLLNNNIVKNNDSVPSNIIIFNISLHEFAANIMFNEYKPSSMELCNTNCLSLYLSYMEISEIHYNNNIHSGHNPIQSLNIPIHCKDLILFLDYHPVLLNNDLLIDYRINNFETNNHNDLILNLNGDTHIYIAKELNIGQFLENAKLCWKSIQMMKHSYNYSIRNTYYPNSRVIGFDFANFQLNCNSGSTLTFQHSNPLKPMTNNNINNNNYNHFNSNISNNYNTKLSFESEYVQYINRIAKCSSDYRILDNFIANNTHSFTTNDLHSNNNNNHLLVIQLDSFMFHLLRESGHQNYLHENFCKKQINLIDNDIYKPYVNTENNNINNETANSRNKSFNEFNELWGREISISLNKIKIFLANYEYPILRSECIKMKSEFYLGKLLCPPIFESGYNFHTVPNQRDPVKFIKTSVIPSKYYLNNCILESWNVELIYSIVYMESLQLLVEAFNKLSFPDTEVKLSKNISKLNWFDDLRYKFHINQVQLISHNKLLFKLFVNNDNEFYPNYNEFFALNCNTITLTSNIHNDNDDKSLSLNSFGFEFSCSNIEISLYADNLNLIDLEQDPVFVSGPLLTIPNFKSTIRINYDMKYITNNQLINTHYIHHYYYEYCYNLPKLNESDIFLSDLFAYYRTRNLNIRLICVLNSPSSINVRWPFFSYFINFMARTQETIQILTKSRNQNNKNNNNNNDNNNNKQLGSYDYNVYEMINFVSLSFSISGVKAELLNYSEIFTEFNAFADINAIRVDSDYIAFDCVFYHNKINNSFKIQDIALDAVQTTATALLRDSNYKQSNTTTATTTTTKNNNNNNNNNNSHSNIYVNFLNEFRKFISPFDCIPNGLTKEIFASTRLIAYRTVYNNINDNNNINNNINEWRNIFSSFSNDNDKLSEQENEIWKHFTYK